LLKRSRFINTLKFSLQFDWGNSLFNTHSCLDKHCRSRGRRKEAFCFCSQRNSIRRALSKILSKYDCSAAAGEMALLSPVSDAIISLLSVCLSKWRGFCLIQPQRTWFITVESGWWCSELKENGDNTLPTGSSERLSTAVAHGVNTYNRTNNKLWQAFTLGNGHSHGQDRCGRSGLGTEYTLN